MSDLNTARTSETGGVREGESCYDETNGGSQPPNAESLLSEYTAPPSEATHKDRRVTETAWEIMKDRRVHGKVGGKRASASAQDNGDDDTLQEEHLLNARESGRIKLRQSRDAHQHSTLRSTNGGRPPSASSTRPASAARSRPASAARGRPVSATQKRPMSAGTARPQSASSNRSTSSHRSNASAYSASNGGTGTGGGAGANQAPRVDYVAQGNRCVRVRMSQGPYCAFGKHRRRQVSRSRVESKTGGRAPDPYVSEYDQERRDYMAGKKSWTANVPFQAAFGKASTGLKPAPSINTNTPYLPPSKYDYRSQPAVADSGKPSFGAWIYQ